MYDKLQPVSHLRESTWLGSISLSGKSDDAIALPTSDQVHYRVRLMQSLEIS